MDLDDILTSEMTAEQWSQFRAKWIADMVTDLVTECGRDPNDSHILEMASIYFEEYCGQEGYIVRDEAILSKREALCRGGHDIHPIFWEW